MRKLLLSLLVLVLAAGAGAAIYWQRTGQAMQAWLTADGLEWTLETGSADAEAAVLVLEWARIQEELPGRLRPCANPECTKFLLDRSKPNTARWCSMAGCGNRMKARRHYARRTAQPA